MGKTIVISEKQLSTIISNLTKTIVNEELMGDIDELDFTSFHESENLQQLRDAIDNNKTVSVAFVKKDGSVRHMAVRKYLSSYVASEEPKTDAQLNVQENHNLKRVVDINAYKKELRSLKIAEPDADIDDLKKKAAKKAWRSINLTTVLGFLVSGRFIDLRDENDILNRFGQEVYSSLTKGMISAMENDAPPQEGDAPQNPEQNN